MQSWSITLWTKREGALWGCSTKSNLHFLKWKVLPLTNLKRRLRPISNVLFLRKSSSTDLNKPTNWQARLNIKLRVAKTCALINLSLRIDTLSNLTSAKNCCLNRRKEMHKLRLHLSPVCSKHNVRETLTIWRRTSNSWKIGRRKEFKTGGKTTKLELKIKPELSTSKTEKWTFLRLNLKKN